MILVIFEATPAPGARQTYFDRAAELRGALADLDGFISIERFQSLADPDKVLSLSVWRDEAAVAAWRQHTGHRAAQADGRSHLFTDYRLRVATVERDYGPVSRDQAPG